MPCNLAASLASSVRKVVSAVHDSSCALRMSYSLSDRLFVRCSAGELRSARLDREQCARERASQRERVRVFVSWLASHLGERGVPRHEVRQQLQTSHELLRVVLPILRPRAQHCLCSRVYSCAHFCAQARCVGRRCHARSSLLFEGHDLHGVLQGLLQIVEFVVRFCTGCVQAGAIWSNINPLGTRHGSPNQSGKESTILIVIQARAI